VAYLAQWQLKLGAEILQSIEESVAEVAAKWAMVRKPPSTPHLHP
jgi:hypothetical protein